MLWCMTVSVWENNEKEGRMLYLLHMYFQCQLHLWVSLLYQLKWADFSRLQRIEVSVLAYTNNPLSSQLPGIKHSFVCSTLFQTSHLWTYFVQRSVHLLQPYSQLLETAQFKNHRNKHRNRWEQEERLVKDSKVTQISILQVTGFKANAENTKKERTAPLSNT